MKIIAEDNSPEPLLQPFEDALRTAGHGLFTPGRPITVARAPARLDCMGGIADYCGATVFEAPLGRAVVVGWQPREDARLVVRSLATELNEDGRNAEFCLDDIDAAAYAEVGRRLSREPARAWAAYVLGALAVLRREEDVPTERGANMLVWSNIPIGVGVASSAALEVAALSAACGALGVELPGTRLAALAQLVENKVVGAPCGIMDQVTSALGEPGKLLALQCRPCRVLGRHRLPAGVRLFGLSSRVEHRVSGAAYTNARVAAFMGMAMVNARRADRDEPPLRYLCELSPEDYIEHYRAGLPEHMSGAEFMAAHGSTPDPVTTVDPDLTYRVRPCTDHPIFENRRVERFIRCMERARAGDRTALVEAGGLMQASHWSYGWNCHMGCRETDLIADLVRRRGPDQGLYGAKITGGGSGGTVAILAGEDAEPLVRRIADEYEEATGLKPDLFDSTSPGACAFGTRTYRMKETHD
jgi:L-arabinokinase